ncbi:M14 family metallopeptidase [soil metagenome]
MTNLSPSYQHARSAWLAAATERGAAIDSLQHPLTGPEGEGLSMDVATFGNPTAGKVLVIACGTHGIEGYAGSAVQTAWLRQGGPGELPADVGVMLIHAVNPWGFAHWQRGTENNVDLNRNFRSFTEAPPANPGYAELHPQLMLSDWTEAELDRTFAAMDAFRARVGEQAFSDAFNGGQYSHAEGVFYGGDRPEWSNLALRDMLRRHLRAARRCVLVDLHTGIGPYGLPFLINFDAPGSFGRECALEIWGEEALSGKGSTHTALASFQGLMIDAFAGELPGCEVSALAAEFGTLERRKMQRAHLAMAWMRRQPASAQDSAGMQAARTEYREAFIPSDPAWQASVLRTGVALCQQGIDGLVTLSRRLIA